MRKLLTCSLIALSFAFGACATTDQYQPKPFVELENADWTRDAVLYQLNTRQFTQEGTFKAAQAQIPRLKSMGVDIIWLMPIHPIGIKNRKGTLGSPYSVRDYFDVNPEFGSKEDLRNFIKTAHENGMHVILDLVANHTAWDNDMVKNHPEWYEKDWRGNFHPTPWWDWSDIIDLNYENAKLRKYMTKAMVYWVKEFDIDGYRADVAGYVPTDFWEQARKEMEAIKPVFMLGEWNQRDLHKRAFDATYAWEWHKTAKSVAKGNGDATAFYGYYSENESAWPMAAMRMPYIENHDSNSWEGSVKENFGDGLKAMLALQFIGEGIPMIYNGQEACNTKRLEFFEKDAIKWQNCELDSLLKQLIDFKTKNHALHNGKFGGRMIKVENNLPNKIFSFVRMKDKNKVLGIFNFSNQSQKFRLSDNLPVGEYKDLNGNSQIITNDEMTLGAWEFKILSH